MKTLDAAGFDDVNAVGEKLKQGMSRIMTQAGLQNQVIGPPTLFDFFLIDRPVHDYRGACAVRSQHSSYRATACFLSVWGTH
jgi:glutamate-1-semialdehyde aminotransferase